MILKTLQILVAVAVLFLAGISADAAEKIPLIEEGQEVHCFSEQLCVHHAIMKSNYIKAVRESQGTSRLVWRKPEMIQISENGYLVGLDIGPADAPKMLFLVELDLARRSWSMEMKVTTRSTIMPVGIEGR